MDSMRCIVEKIIFSNTENGFSVMSVNAYGYSNLVTVVGIINSVNIGSILSLKGEWKESSKYGRQFAFSEYEEVMPSSKEGIKRYLGSGLISGVGPKIASRIVNAFGEETLAIIENEPERLYKISGIGKRRIKRIIESFNEQKEVRNVMVFLQTHGIGISLAYRIYKELGNECIGIITSNPYRLTEVWGIGFKTADKIAAGLGFDSKSPFRVFSGIIFSLEECCNSGHCFMPREDILEKASKLLELESSALRSTLDDMIKNKDLIFENPDRIYLPGMYYSECGVANRLNSILSKRNRNRNLTAAATGQIEKELSIKYAEAQKEAIRIATSSKIMIITGGPGTGKTTAVKGIITVFNSAKMRVLLAAPTGRAAKRMSEATGMEAKTIHRLLEARPPDGYDRNEDNKLEGNVLIIDESSMIDIVLMHNLLKAVPDDMSLIFIGDVDQLPPVGPGNVLRDMINSNAIPVVKLSHIFRQAMGSQIIMNAHRINNGQRLDLKNKENSDFFFIKEENNSVLSNTIVELCTKRLPEFFSVAPYDIQVLSPMRRGENGVNNLNMLLQNALNPTDAMIRRGGTEYRLYDKVMQIKNNYEKKVFNGDIGQIVGINEEEGIVSVRFDEIIPVYYEINELDELVLAYATTVHKAQGSEYDIVVLPITDQHYMMLQRNLLYTGITRAKRAVVLVGTENAIWTAVKNNHISNRNTGLTTRLNAN